LLLEVSTFAAVQQQGHQRATWYTLEQGLFSDRPHAVLFESFWHEAQAVAIERFYIIDAETSEVTQHSISSQAYTDEQYRQLVQNAGFTDMTFYPSLIGQPDERQKDFIAIRCAKINAKEAHETVLMHCLKSQDDGRIYQLWLPQPGTL
jgi:hypothetical protein